MQSGSQLPILYSFRRCPYALRARIALQYAGIRVELREVVLRDKPAEMLAASPKGTVPVMVLAANQPDERVLEESLDIMHWALDVNDPDNWLVADAKATAELIASNDSEFKFWLDRYKYPQRYTDIGQERPLDRCIEFLQSLESRLGSRQYLFGDTITLADVALFPFVRQFAFVDKARFDALPLTAVKMWLERFLQAALFTGVMHKYPAWKSGDEVTIF